MAYHARVRLWLLLLLLSSSPLALARWAKLDDAPAISRLDHEKIQVKLDGIYRSERETLVEIRNDEGRTSFGFTSLKYNAKTTHIKILQAETRNLNGTYPVLPEFIEDKPLASTADGFDETRQVSIAYPKVEVGSKIYLRYEEQVSEVAFPNFFSSKFYFGTDIPEENSKITIESQLPLLLQKNDPEGLLVIEQNPNGAGSSISIQAVKTAFLHPVDEEEPYLNANAFPWVVVSSNAKFSDLGEMYADKYEQIINSPLPPSFEKILEAAKLKKDPITQLNIITSLLADQVRYLGDWRPSDGGHVPRNLEKIASTKFGDCKDLSVVTTAIARRLGIESYVAWLERGSRPTPLPEIALDTAFNHAIVAVKIKGVTHWVDPTNFASFAQGLFEDILGREALVIMPHHCHLEKIPVGEPSDATTIRNLEFHFAQDGDAVIKANLSFRGRTAIPLTGIGKEMSKAAVKHLITSTLSENRIVRWSQISDYDLTSRITEDTHLLAELEVANLSLRTTAGNAYNLAWEDLGKINHLDPEQRVSDFPLGTPETIVSDYTLKGIKTVGTLPVSCQVDSPWLTASRSVHRRPDGMTVEDRKQSKLLVISAHDYHQNSFAAFQAKLRACFEPIAIVYREIKNPASVKE